jgi:hypothetical protein
METAFKRLAISLCGAGGGFCSTGGASWAALMFSGAAISTWGVAVGMTCVALDRVNDNEAEPVVVSLGVRRTDVVAVVLTKLEVRLVVVVDAVLDDIKFVVVVADVELGIVVVATESVVVFSVVSTVVVCEVAVVTGAVVTGVVAAVVGVTGSARTGTIPPESAVSEMAVPNANATAAPRQKRTWNGDALIVAQPLSFHLQRRPNVSPLQQHSCDRDPTHHPSHCHTADRIVGQVVFFPSLD